MAVAMSAMISSRRLLEVPLLPDILEVKKIGVVAVEFNAIVVITSYL